MEIERKIHLVIYSKLENYGGGRETWANYFLKALDKVGKFKDINIYCLGSDNYSNTLVDEFNSYENIHFFTTIPDLKKNVLFRMMDFTKYVEKKLNENSNNGDTVLFLGAMMEGFVALYVNLKIKQNLKFILWIRSIGLRELSTRRNKISVFLLKIIERNIFNRADAIIFNGKDTYDYYEKKYSKLIKKMYVVENAVNLEQFSSIKKPKFMKNIINVTYIGRFNKEKGFFDFIESINIYNSKYNNNEYETRIKFNIWGFGDDFRLPQNTTYHGILERENICEVLSESHIVVFLNLSNSELAAGLSHGLLEAMASKRVCLAYNNPAHNQILTSDNCIFIKEGDVNELAGKYFEIIKNINENNVDLYEAISINALYSANPYSVENHINKFLNIYEATQNNY